MKLAGYTQGMINNNLPPLTVQIVSDTISYYKVIAIVQEMLSSTVFDAVFSADDSLAIGAAKALNNKGCPPMPMIGFNNTILGLCASPELSTVDNCMVQQCDLTVKTLLNVLHGTPPSSCITLDAKLIFRGNLGLFLSTDSLDFA